jgi:hypothetical protein
MIENKVPDLFRVVRKTKIFEYLAAAARNHLTPEMRPAVGKSP